MLHKIKNFLLDTLFPVSCISCARPDSWLCDDCFSKINLRRDQTCPICEKNITPDGRTCFHCQKKSSIAGLLVASSYKDKLIVRAIHYYKYRFIEDLSNPLGKIMTESILGSQLPIPEAIVPVPLHKRRLRWRGFNQAELLADYLSMNLAPGYDVPVLKNILVRRRFTHPQMKIRDYFQRKKNIENAFLVLDSSEIKDKTLFLVDDIATTGSTLFECAKTLKENGAKEIFAVVIARQEINNS